MLKRPRKVIKIICSRLTANLILRSMACATRNGSWRSRIPRLPRSKSTILVDARFVRKLDENGFIDRLYGAQR